MKRRDFLKLCLLSMPSIYLFPEMLFPVHDEELSEKDRFSGHKPILAGKFYREIKDGKVFVLEEPFKPLLTSRRVHFLAVDRRYLKLIPEDKSGKDRIEKEIKKFATIKPEIKISYLGMTRLSKDGYLFIPQKVRRLAGLPATGDLVIVGMIDSIEIWDKKSWDVEIEKNLKTYRETIKKSLAKYGV